MTLPNGLVFKRCDGGFEVILGGSPEKYGIVKFRIGSDLVNSEFQVATIESIKEYLEEPSPIYSIVTEEELKELEQKCTQIKAFWKIEKFIRTTPELEALVAEAVK